MHKGAAQGSALTINQPRAPGRRKPAVHADCPATGWVARGVGPSAQENVAATCLGAPAESISSCNKV